MNKIKQVQNSIQIVYKKLSLLQLYYYYYWYHKKNYDIINNMRLYKIFYRFAFFI